MFVIVVGQLVHGMMVIMLMIPSVVAVSALAGCMGVTMRVLVAMDEIAMPVFVGMGVGMLMPMLVGLAHGGLPPRLQPAAAGS